MAYRHQTVNLKQPLRKSDLEAHVKGLRREFYRWQSTSYSIPEGLDVDDMNNWEKEVTKCRYLVYPVENKFGIAVDIGSQPHNPYNQRMATAYPSLGLAVLEKPRHYHRQDRSARFTKKLERLGYCVAAQESVQMDMFKKSWKTSPYEIVAEESGMFRSEAIFEDIVKNVDRVIARRPEINLCEVAVFSPPGDGGWNSPIGKTDDPYKEGVILNPAVKMTVPVLNGCVDRERLAEIYEEMTPSQAMGLTSRRHPPLSKLSSGELEHASLDYDGLHSAMIDFRCSRPEDAIHTMEEMGVEIDPQKVVLIDSGNSFHAHFPETFQTDEFARDYLEGLEQRDDVCQQWAPLQQEQGFQLLRVSPCMRKPRIPVVLDL